MDADRGADRSGLYGQAQGGCQHQLRPPAAVGLNTTLITDQRILAGGVAPPLVNIKEKNPYAGDTASAKEGKALFQSMNCDGCHGPTGEGAWAPSIISGRWRYGGSDPTVFQTIFYGRPRGMPAYGGMLGPDLTWKLVTFLRSVPAPKVVPTQAWWPPSSRPSPPTPAR